MEEMLLKRLSPIHLNSKTWEKFANFTKRDKLTFLLQKEKYYLIALKKILLIHIYTKKSAPTCTFTIIQSTYNITASVAEPRRLITPLALYPMQRSINFHLVLTSAGHVMTLSRASPGKSTNFVIGLSLINYLHIIFKRPKRTRMYVCILIYFRASFAYYGNYTSARICPPISYHTI